MGTQRKKIELKLPQFSFNPMHDCIWDTEFELQAHEFSAHVSTAMDTWATSLIGVGGHKARALKIVDAFTRACRHGILHGSIKLEEYGMARPVGRKGDVVGFKDVRIYASTQLTESAQMEMRAGNFTLGIAAFVRKWGGEYELAGATPRNLGQQGGLLCSPLLIDPPISGGYSPYFSID